MDEFTSKYYTNLFIFKYLALRERGYIQLLFALHDVFQVNQYLSNTSVIVSARERTSKGALSLRTSAVSGHEFVM
mgnify:FL=1